MQNLQSTSSKAFLAIIALGGWFALITQFYININSGVAPAPEIVIRYFSYFTITTNLLVAVCCTILLLSPNSTWARFFSRYTTLTAITVYIVIVGIIYNLILRFIWAPKGLQRVVDELLHTVIPLLFLIFWIAFVTKQSLKWKAIVSWLIYPLVYIVFALVRGSFSGHYPYPFFHIGQLGLQQVLVNSVGIAAAFIVMSLLFIVTGNFINKKNTRAL